MDIERIKLLAEIVNDNQRALIVEMLDSLRDEIQYCDSFESPAYKKALEFRIVIQEHK